MGNGIRHSRSARWGLLPALVIVAGCGRGEPETAPVVEPPPPTLSEPAGDAGHQDHPGGIELPPGEIPSPGADPLPAAEPAIQMPDDASLEPSSAAAAARIRYATWDEIQAAAASTGKVTVVDLWSLTCAPCLKEFPQLVELQHEMAGKVAAMAVNLDYDGRKSRPPEHYAERVENFLRDVGADEFPTYISQTPSEEIFTSMEIASLPAVLVYHANGELAEMFVDAGAGEGISYEAEIVPLVTELLR